MMWCSVVGPGGRRGGVMAPLYAGPPVDRTRYASGMEQHPPLLRLLRAEEHPELRAHLARCPRCRAEVRIYRASFGDAPPPAEPDAPEPASEQRYSDLAALG